VLHQPVVDPLGLAIGVAGVEEAQQHHGIQAQAGQDAQIEVEGVQRRAHDLGVGGNDGEALLALGAEVLEVEIDIGLLSNALQEALDDLWLHDHEKTRRNTSRAVSSWLSSTNSSAAWACSMCPGPNTTASMPAAANRAASVQ